jgi:hypothetical protein
MAVRSVQPPAGEGALQPAEQSLMTDVHPERYLGATSVPTKVPLSNQQPDEQADLVVGGHKESFRALPEDAAREDASGCPGGVSP